MIKTKDEATNIDCRAQADLYQPKGSLYPKSLHITGVSTAHVSCTSVDVLEQVMLHGSMRCCNVTETVWLRRD